VRETFRKHVGQGVRFHNYDYTTVADCAAYVVDVLRVCRCVWRPACRLLALVVALWDVVEDGGNNRTFCVSLVQAGTKSRNRAGMPQPNCLGGVDHPLEPGFIVGMCSQELGGTRSEIDVERSRGKFSVKHRVKSDEGRQLRQVGRFYTVTAYNRRACSVIDPSSQLAYASRNRCTVTLEYSPSNMPRLSIIRSSSARSSISMAT